MKQKTIVVIPALNEEKTISKVIRGVRKYVDEIILVDDASTDKTAIIAQQEGAMVLAHEKNQGCDKSISGGFAWAAKRKATIVLTFDGDGQHDPRDIPKIIKPILNGKADVVVGKRPHYAKAAEYLFAFMLKAKVGIDDPLCGLKAYHIKVYKDIGYFSKVFSGGTQLLFNAKKRGYTIAQENIILHERDGVPRLGKLTPIGRNWKTFKTMIKILVGYGVLR